MNAAPSLVSPSALVALVGFLIGTHAPMAHAMAIARAASTPCDCGRYIDRQGSPAAVPDAAEEQAAAEQYVANLHALLEERVVRALRRAIVETAASRPSSLSVEVTEDPSPYNVGAKLDADGSLKVRLTLGYTTMHDAALDAVMLSAPLHQSQALRPYLVYQLLTARENYARRARGEPARRAKTFAEFAGLDRDVIRPVYARREWRAERDRVEVESLGWIVAYLLARADPKLGGSLSFPTSPPGRAAARLAAASDWFPVPPFATAFQWADVVRSPVRAWDGGALLCRAALFMESGVAAFKVDGRWQARLQQDESLQSRLAKIRSDIIEMRRDARCTSTGAQEGHDVA
jgi:hypothetical protein